MNFTKNCETSEFNLLYKNNFTIYIVSTKTIFKRSIGKLLLAFTKNKGSEGESLQNCNNF